MPPDPTRFPLLPAPQYPFASDGLDIINFLISLYRVYRLHRKTVDPLKLELVGICCIKPGAHNCGGKNHLILTQRRPYKFVKIITKNIKVYYKRSFFHGSQHIKFKLVANKAVFQNSRLISRSLSQVQHFISHEDPSKIVLHTCNVLIMCSEDLIR